MDFRKEVRLRRLMGIHVRLREHTTNPNDSLKGHTVHHVRHRDPRVTPGRPMGPMTTHDRPRELIQLVRYVGDSSWRTPNPPAICDGVVVRLDTTVSNLGLDFDFYYAFHWYSSNRSKVCQVYFSLCDFCLKEVTYSRFRYQTFFYLFICNNELWMIWTLTIKESEGWLYYNKKMSDDLYTNFVLFSVSR